MSLPISIRPVVTAADRRRFVDLAWRVYADDPNWVPPLKDEVHGLLDPKRNPWFGHARAQFFLAQRGGEVVGRISGQIDSLVQSMPTNQGGGPGVGHWGMLEALDGKAAAALIAAAEDWLRAQGATQAMGPFSLSVWDEPGLLVQGHDHPPTVMMGHHLAAYEAWVEASGYRGVKDLYTYDLPIGGAPPPLVARIIASAERNPRIRVRKVVKANFAAEASLILNILNDAWSQNWGYVPLTDAEIAYAGKKLKPIVFEDLIRIAEVDGEPVGFMMTLPDLNELTGDLNGALYPFGWIKLLLRLRKPRVKTMRVPLMGVLQRLQGTRLASQLAFMLIEQTREAAFTAYGATRGEIGWVLDDNQAMISIADAIHSKVNKVYRIYSKAL